MSIVERVKRLCLSPTSEWPVIAEEPVEPVSLITSYILPLAAIGAVAGLIGGSLIGTATPFGTFRVPLATGLQTALLVVVMAVVGVFVVAAIINALAPTFGAQKSFHQALKIAAYSFTPGLVAGVLQILPLLGTLALLASFYGLYLMFLGLPRLMRCPEDRALGYTAVVVACCLALGVAFVLVASVVGLSFGAARSLAGNVGGAGAPDASEVQLDANSPLGKLQQLGKELEKSGKKMEAAEKSGDQGAQVSAALEGLGTLFGGGARVDPVSIEELKKFVPETLGGLPKTSNSAEKSGLGIMVSRAEATYGQRGNGADKEVRLEIVDTGGVSGLVGVASWMGLQEEKESDSGYERTRKVDGRMTHEKVSTRGGTNEYTVVVGERFTVTATSDDFDIDALKSAVASLNLGGLDAMKNAGVQSAQK